MNTVASCTNSCRLLFSESDNAICLMQELWNKNVVYTCTDRPSSTSFLRKFEIGLTKLTSKDKYSWWILTQSLFNTMSNMQTFILLIHTIPALSETQHEKFTSTNIKHMLILCSTVQQSAHAKKSVHVPGMLSISESETLPLSLPVLYLEYVSLFRTEQ